MFRRMYGGLSEKLPRQAIVAAALVFAVVIISGGSISGFARGRKEEDVSYKYYTSIRVEKGDTLWSIALDHMTPEYKHIEEYIREVRSLNHLYGDDIHAGAYLTLPKYRSYTTVQNW